LLTITFCSFVPHKTKKEEASSRLEILGGTATTINHVLILTLLKRAGKRTITVLKLGLMGLCVSDEVVECHAVEDDLEDDLDFRVYGGYIYHRRRVGVTLVEKGILIGNPG
jgi:hypothetical protein